MPLFVMKVLSYYSKPRYSRRMDTAPHSKVQLRPRKVHGYRATQSSAATSTKSAWNRTTHSFCTPWKLNGTLTTNIVLSAFAFHPVRRVSRVPSMHGQEDRPGGRKTLAGRAKSKMISKYKHNTTKPLNCRGHKGTLGKIGFTSIRAPTCTAGRISGTYGGPP